MIHSITFSMHTPNRNSHYY